MSTLSVFDVVPEPAPTNHDSTISGEPLVTLDAFGTSRTDEEKEAKLVAEDNRQIEEAERDLADLATKEQKEKQEQEDRNREQKQKEDEEAAPNFEPSKQQPSF